MYKYTTLQPPYSEYGNFTLFPKSYTVAMYVL